MTFTVPKFSRSQVNKAGRILASPLSHSENELAEANAVLTNWRAAHAYPINTFQATLRDRTKALGTKAFIAQRLKRAPSILKKLTRLEKMELARMQDIGGIRAVLPTIGQVRHLEKAYLHGHLKHILVRRDDYIEAPKSDGYRSVHLVFRYRNDGAPAYSGLHVELQLRTALQHAWATAVETMGTYLGISLKSGEGSEPWNRFFVFTSAGFAIKEDLPVPFECRQLSYREICQEIERLERELNVLPTLKSFSIATDQIAAQRGSGAYHLIVLDSENKYVEITPYSKSRLDIATAEYAEVEKRISGGERIEAVLVSAGPVAALRRAFPNYFLDTHTFIREVKRMIKDGSQVAQKRYMEQFEQRGKSMDSVSLPSISSWQIPQADSIDSIRVVLLAVYEGASTVKDISLLTGISARHVNYRLLAAEILGCVTGGKYKKISPEGAAWLRREQGSEEEARFLRNIIEDTVFYKLVVPDLFDLAPPNKSLISKRIMSCCEVSKATAERRASSLVSWSNRLRQCSLSISSDAI